MKIIGLTGGIGSGKTIVAKVFKKLGIPVYNSDIEAKKLMNSDSDIINKLKMIFGYDIYNENNQLDRKKLAKYIFNDKDKLNTVNGIVHPAVKKHFRKWADSQNAIYIIKESAILFETGIYKDADKIISVLCPENIRIRRVMNRDKISKDDVIKRINNQTNDDYKKINSDFIIINDEKQLIIPQILRIRQNLCDLFGKM